MTINMNIGEAKTRLSELIAATGFDSLHFPFACIKDEEALPYIHRDPFDRILVAHARYMQGPLVTCDAAIAHYPVEPLR